MRTIRPAMADENHKTEVIIAPIFESDDLYEYPAARINVIYYENERKIFSVFFEKVLSESSPLAICDNEIPVNEKPVVRIANDMLNEKLDKVGLESLETLDLYKIASTYRMPLLHEKYAIIKILEKALGLPYLDYDTITEACLPSYRPPIEGFYNFDIDY